MDLPPVRPAVAVEAPRGEAAGALHGLPQWGVVEEAGAEWRAEEENTMKAKEYPLLLDAVEVGVASGWRRAFKHREGEPAGAEAIREAIREAVITELLERFDLDDAVDPGL